MGERDDAAENRAIHRPVFHAVLGLGLSAMKVHIQRFCFWIPLLKKYICISTAEPLCFQPNTDRKGRILMKEYGRGLEEMT